MVGLVIERINSVVRLSGVLVSPDKEALREPVRHQTMDGSDTLRPMVAERDASAAPKLEPRQTGVADTGLKSRGEYHAVDIIGLVSDDHGSGRKSLDAAAAGIDEMDVRQIEARDQVVMKARPFA